VKVHHTFTAHGKEKILIKEKVLQSNTLTTESLLELMICTAPLQYNHITRQGQYYIKADLLHKN
jgi:hypothetical protein